MIITIYHIINISYLYKMSGYVIINIIIYQKKQGIFNVQQPHVSTLGQEWHGEFQHRQQHRWSSWDLSYHILGWWKLWTSRHAIFIWHYMAKFPYGIPYFGLVACEIWLNIQKYFQIYAIQIIWIWAGGFHQAESEWGFYNTGTQSHESQDWMFFESSALWDASMGQLTFFLREGKAWRSPWWRIGVTQNFWGPDRSRITCFNIQKLFEYYQVEECMYLNHGQCRTLVLVSFLTSLQGPIAKSSYFLGCALRWLRILMPTHRFWHLYSPIFEASALLVCLMVVKQ